MIFQHLSSNCKLAWLKNLSRRIAEEFWGIMEKQPLTDCELRCLAESLAERMSPEEFDKFARQYLHLKKVEDICCLTSNNLLRLIITNSVEVERFY